MWVGLVIVMMMVVVGPMQQPMSPKDGAAFAEDSKEEAWTRWNSDWDFQWGYLY